MEVCMNHRLAQANPGTMVVMRVEKERHWETATYEATKNATGFDPNAHNAEVRMWMDPFSESKIKRINGMIPLSHMAGPPLPESLYDEAGRLKPEHRKRNRPSSAARKRRAKVEPEMEIFPILTVIEPTELGAVETHQHDPQYSEAPAPLVPTEPSREQEQADAFAARWRKVNEAAEVREAEFAKANPDSTFVLEPVPDVAEVPVNTAPTFEVPVRRPKLSPILGRAKVQMNPNTTDQTEQWTRPADLRG